MRASQFPETLPQSCSPHAPGATAIPIFGQSLTVGTDNILTDFTFWTKAHTDLGQLNTTAKVFQWDKNARTTVGQSLYTSGTFVLGTTSTFAATTINTSNLELVTGTDYVLIFEADDNQPGRVAFGGWGADILAGTKFEFYDSISNSWSPAEWDLAFTANFTSSNPGNNAVPEPSEWAAMGLLGTGLLGLVVRGRKKKMAN